MKKRSLLINTILKYCIVLRPTFAQEPLVLTRKTPRSGSGTNHIIQANRDLLTSPRNNKRGYAGARGEARAALVQTSQELKLAAEAHMSPQAKKNECTPPASSLQGLRPVGVVNFSCECGSPRSRETHGENGLQNYQYWQQCVTPRFSWV